jgi:hypothetical protein
MAVLCFSWFFARKWTSSKILQCLLVGMVGLQFPVWGFSFQARGYELLLLCSCVSLGSFLAYFGQRSAKWLTPHTLANVAGMMALPTYLYWWLGLLLASALVQRSSRSFDRRFVAATLSGGAWCLLLALPLLSFSGIGAVAANRYVQRGDTSAWEFLGSAQYFNGLFSEWFCMGDGTAPAGALCLLLPVLLFTYPRHNKHRKLLGTVYYSMLLAFILVATVMAKLPFYRNLIAHGYLALFVNIIAILPLFRSKTMHIALCVGILMVSIYFGIQNHKSVPNKLYYYDVAEQLLNYEKKPLNLLPGQPIYLEYEAFNWWHILRSKYPGKQIAITCNRPKESHGKTRLHFPCPADSSIYQLLPKLEAK